MYSADFNNYPLIIELKSAVNRWRIGSHGKLGYNPHRYPFIHLSKEELEDLKVLRRSPDLLNNVKIGQGQLQLIMEQILFYHIWGLQTFWSSDLNNLMNNPSNSPVISEKHV